MQRRKLICIFFPSRAFDRSVAILVAGRLVLPAVVQRRANFFAVDGLTEILAIPTAERAAGVATLKDDGLPFIVGVQTLIAQAARRRLPTAFSAMTGCVRVSVKKSGRFIRHRLCRFTWMPLSRRPGVVVFVEAPY